MTVIVMGICYAPNQADPGLPVMPYIVAACDTMLSGNYSTVAEGNICKIQKAGFLGTWLVGYTGDPTHFPHLRDCLARRLGPLSGDLGVTPDELKTFAEEMYSQYRERVIRRKFLRPLHIEPH